LSIYHNTTTHTLYGDVKQTKELLVSGIKASIQSIKNKLSYTGEFISTDYDYIMFMDYFPEVDNIETSDIIEDDTGKIYNITQVTNLDNYDKYIRIYANEGKK